MTPIYSGASISKVANTIMLEVSDRASLSSRGCRIHAIPATAPPAVSTIDASIIGETMLCAELLKLSGREAWRYGPANRHQSTDSWQRKRRRSRAKPGHESTRDLHRRLDSNASQAPQVRCSLLNRIVGPGSFRRRSARGAWKAACCKSITH